MLTSVLKQAIRIFGALLHVPWNPEIFSLTNECEAKSWSQIRENLWAHTLGPLNVPIQSEAVSESNFPPSSFLLYQLTKYMYMDSNTFPTFSPWADHFFFFLLFQVILSKMYGHKKLVIEKQ